MVSVELSYYYGYESEQFSFYRIPKLLFTDSRFANLSTDAKLLYGMIPVSYQQGQNGSYTLYLGNGSFRHTSEQYKGYTMMASVSMEDREIAVGFHSQASHQYAVWDWQPNHKPKPM